MNCEDFNDKLPEFLDGTLTVTKQTAAAEHAHECGECRKALERQESFAKALRDSFERETRGLSLSAETRRKIITAAGTPEPATTVWESIRAYFSAARSRTALAGMCLALLISGGYLFLRPKNGPTPPAARDDRHTYVVDVPVRSETYVFQRQGNAVVDAVITETGVADASFTENFRPPTLPKSQLNQSNL